jgi:hypothetical protein
VAESGFMLEPATPGTAAPGPAVPMPRRGLPSLRDSGFGDSDPQDSTPGGGGLPRRVRQAGLAPQLRKAPAPQHPPGETPLGEAPQDDEPKERTPEQVRDRMTAYRHGWVRGSSRPHGPGE